jgi:dihydrofolate reductase
MRLSLVLASSSNNIIGDNGTVPWHQPADLQHFRALTVGHPVIMGRKTYQAIGKQLPDRQNIILSRKKHYNAPGCTVVTTLEQALKTAWGGSEIFVIGGSEIFKLTEPMATKAYLTKIHTVLNGDTSFILNQKLWEQQSAEDHKADDLNQYDYSFIILSKIINNK